MVVRLKTPIRKISSPLPFSPDTPVIFKINQTVNRIPTTKTLICAFMKLGRIFFNLATLTESPLSINNQIESYPGTRVQHILSLLNKQKNTDKLHQSMLS